MPTLDWWLSLMPTTVGWSLPDGDPCSDHSTMIIALVTDDGSLLSHEDPDDVVEPMMLTQRWLMVIVVMEPLCWWCSPWRWWSHVGDALLMSSCLHWCMWLDPMLYDALEPWVSAMMEMTWYIGVMCLSWALMTWYIDVMSCLLMRIPLPTLPCAIPSLPCTPFPKP